MGLWNSYNIHLVHICISVFQLTQYKAILICYCFHLRLVLDFWMFIGRAVLLQQEMVPLTPRPGLWGRSLLAMAILPDAWPNGECSALPGACNSSQRGWQSRRTAMPLVAVTDACGDLAPEALGITVPWSQESWRDALESHPKAN